MTPPFADRAANLRHFADCRLGLFLHYGLYSLLGRGEWALNKEMIPVAEYRQLADRFTAERFDANAIAQMAVDMGARYACLTTMHHDGFALYESKVNPFNTVNTAAKRDLVVEFVTACRKHGLRVHLYHSLNHWTCKPDAADALESQAAWSEFIDFTHARIKELVTLFNPIDCLWYDGWWPFNAQGWRSVEMNAMVQAIQPQILFNGRNALPGDFATPEQHLSAPRPHRPWEACITHNSNWSYHPGDRCFKPTWDVLGMVLQVAAGAGNLLLNFGPDGSGAIPQPSRELAAQLGRWLRRHGEAIYGSELFDLDLQQRGNHRGDWSHIGRMTTRGHTLYLTILNWPGSSFALGGVQVPVQRVRCVTTDSDVRFQQDGPRVRVEGLPAQAPDELATVLAFDCAQPPVLYMTGGLRVPQSPHPRYDPVTSDLPH